MIIMSIRNIDRCYFPPLYVKRVFATITEQTKENDQRGDARRPLPAEAHWSCSSVSVISEDELFDDVEW